MLGGNVVLLIIASMLFLVYSPDVANMYVGLIFVMEERFSSLSFNPEYMVSSSML